MGAGRLVLMVKKIFKNKLGLGLLLLLCAFKGTVWATTFPLFQAPDEQAHFSYVQYWIENGELPQNAESKEYGVSEELEKTLENLEFEKIQFNPLYQSNFEEGSLYGPNELEILESNWGSRSNQRYLAYNYPPLYYAFLYPAYSLFEGNILAQVMAMRFTSVLLSLITIGLIYGAALAFLKNEWWALGATSLVAFHPMFSYFSAIINNDVTLNLAYAGFFYSGLKVLGKKGVMTLKQGVILLGWTLLGIFSKTQGFGLIPLFVLLIAMKINWKKSFNLKNGGVVFGGVLLSAFFAKLILFPDLGGQLKAYGHFFEGQGVGDLISYLGVYVREAFESFWARFGWLDTTMSSGWILLFKLLTVVALGGLVKIIYEKRKRFKKSSQFLLGSSFIIGGLYLLYFFDKVLITGSMEVHRVDQGRYYFILMVPLLLLGLQGLFRWIPKEWHNHALVLLNIYMVFFNLLALVTVIIPRYYV
jgi:hypothetical protein